MQGNLHTHLRLPLWARPRFVFFQRLHRPLWFVLKQTHWIVGCGPTSGTKLSTTGAGTLRTEQMKMCVNDIVQTNKKLQNKKNFSNLRTGRELEGTGGTFILRELEGTGE